MVAAVAGFAGFLHPVFAAKFLEGFGDFPDFAQAAILHIFEVQSGNDFCGVAGKRFAVWGDEHQLASPAAHAGLGKFRVVIGNDVFDADFAAEAFLRGFQEFEERSSCSRVGRRCSRLAKAQP